MEIILSVADNEWLQTHYPKLKIDVLNKVIEGDIGFTRAYQGYELTDSYKVKISLQIDGVSLLPKVYEGSSKIVEIARKHKKELSDLHINADGSFCLAVTEREEELFEGTFNIKEFFKNSLEPFLFQMSYYDREGRFPWGEYAHGHLAYFELYAEEKIDIKRLFELVEKRDLVKAVTTTRQSACLCGSGKKLRACHPLIYQAISKIKQEL